MTQLNKDDVVRLLKQPRRTDEQNYSIVKYIDDLYLSIIDNPDVDIVSYSESTETTLEGVLNEIKDDGIFYVFADLTDFPDGSTKQLYFIIRKTQSNINYFKIYGYDISDVNESMYFRRATYDTSYVFTDWRTETSKEYVDSTTNNVVTYNRVTDIWQDDTIYKSGTILRSKQDNMIFISDGVTSNIDLVDTLSSLMYVYLDSEDAFNIIDGNYKRISRINIRSHSDNSLKIDVDYCDGSTYTDIVITGNQINLTFDAYKFKTGNPVVMRCTTNEAGSVNYVCNTLIFNKRGADWSDHYIGDEFTEANTQYTVTVADLTAHFSQGTVLITQNPTGVDTILEFNFTPEDNF